MWSYPEDWQGGTEAARGAPAGERGASHQSIAFRGWELRRPPSIGGPDAPMHRMTVPTPAPASEFGPEWLDAEGVLRNAKIRRSLPHGPTRPSHEGPVEIARILRATWRQVFGLVAVSGWFSGFPGSRRFPATWGQCFVTALVATYRCGAVPASNRIPSCDAPSSKSLRVGSEPTVLAGSLWRGRRVKGFRERPFSGPQFPVPHWARPRGRAPWHTTRRRRRGRLPCGATTARG